MINLSDRVACVQAMRQHVVQVAPEARMPDTVGTRMFRTMSIAWMMLLESFESEGAALALPALPWEFRSSTIMLDPCEGQ
jgi:hypothetical protein